MPLFPKIASPCPYVDRLAEIVDGDVCRMCRRQVFDLTAMSDGERLAFLAGCEEEVCVSYRIPVVPAARAAAIAAALALPSGAALARPLPRPQPPVIAVVAGGLAPPPQVQVVEVPKAASAGDVRALYQEGPRVGPDSSAPQQQPPRRPRAD